MVAGPIPTNPRRVKKVSRGAEGIEATPITLTVGTEHILSACSARDGARRGS